MSERVVYKTEWNGPLMGTPKERCLTYYFLKSDVCEFIDSVLMNSTITITPIKVDAMSHEFMEAMRWHNMYRQSP